MLERELGRLLTQPDERVRGAPTENGRLPDGAPLPLSEYYVQYGGVVANGKKLIVGRAHHHSQIKPERILVLPQPNTFFALPFRGGVNYFAVIYDYELKAVRSVVYTPPLPQK